MEKPSHPGPGDTQDGAMEHLIEPLITGCRLCPRECGVNRLAIPGTCGAGPMATVNLHCLHHGEEPVISGCRGSGTVFFAHCAMRCVYCQNHLISHGGSGTSHPISGLRDILLELQEMGGHNVNLVSASHYTPHAAAALRAARERGLSIPVVWNSSAYEKPETLRLLEGLVDVYLPDLRYCHGETASRYSGVPDYPERARSAIREMFRQAGHLRVEEGLAASGLMVRLLLLPGMASEVRNSLAWIRDALGRETWISLMGQYYPAHRAGEFPEINRAVFTEEYGECLECLDDLGFENGFTQEVGSSPTCTPDFAR